LRNKIPYGKTVGYFIFLFDFAARGVNPRLRPKGRVALLPFGNPKALSPQQAAEDELNKWKYYPQITPQRC
jgi:hypothetical protein